MRFIENFRWINAGFRGTSKLKEWCMLQKKKTQKTKTQKKQTKLQTQNKQTN